MNVEYMDHSGDDLLIVNAARTSFAKESKELTDKDAKLIHFLAREKHLLPFRHPTVTFRCRAPLFVARQLGKHQSGMSWSEESRRYIDDEPEFYWPDKWRKRAENVKQGSSDEEVIRLQTKTFPTIYPSGVEGPWIDTHRLAKTLVDRALSVYKEMLEAKVAPEQARMVLPQNMYINWVWTGTLLAWVHMVKQRTAPDTQRETQHFAQLVKAHLEKLYPVSMQALMEHN